MCNCLNKTSSERSSNSKKLAKWSGTAFLLLLLLLPFELVRWHQEVQSRPPRSSLRDSVASKQRRLESPSTICTSAELDGAKRRPLVLLEGFTRPSFDGAPWRETFKHHRPHDDCEWIGLDPRRRPFDGCHVCRWRTTCCFKKSQTKAIV